MSDILELYRAAYRLDKKPEPTPTPARPHNPLTSMATESQEVSASENHTGDGLWKQETRTSHKPL